MKRQWPKFLPKIFWLSILILLLLLSFSFIRKGPFLIKNIVVKTDYPLNPEIVKILEGQKNRHLFEIDEEELAQELTAKDIKIKRVEIKKEFPQRLYLEILARQPLGVIFLNDFFLLFDEEGIIFAQEKERPGLPLVNLGLQNLGIGSTIEKNSQVLEILENFKAKEEIESLELGTEDIKVIFRGGTLAIFPQNGEIKEKINSLQIILNTLRIEGKRPAKIDLRFDKPVLTFEQ